jgi:hypothetical protein
MTSHFCDESAMITFITTTMQNKLYKKEIYVVMFHNHTAARPKVVGYSFEKF